MQSLSKKILFLLTIIAVGVAFSACAGSRAESNNANNANTAPTVVSTTIAPAVQRDLPKYFEATGSLAGDLQTDVAPTVGGKVVSVNFDVGSYVNKGSVLVQLDDRDARIRLEQAQAQVAQAQSQVNQARANVEQARANVNQAAAAIGLRPTDRFDVNNLPEVNNARAALNLAEQELRRVERLIESGDVSRSQYDQRKAQRDQAQAAYNLALNNGQRSFEAVRTAQAAQEAAQAVVITNQRNVEAAQTQVEAAQKAINDAVIYAPVSGSVAERNADPGEFIGTQNKVATIVRTNPLRMRIEVPEQDIANLKAGQSISLTTSAYPDRSFSGTIARVLPNVNATSRTLIAEAEVNNIDGLLKPGQFATVRVLQTETRPAVMIPVRAVIQDGTSNRVFIIRDGRAEQRIVQLGEAEGEMIEVRNGVAANEQVAVSNLETLYDGVAVTQ
jgi:RND family efflux transporter MFP subunit